MVTMIRVDDAISLAAETFGEPDALPTVLLHGGGVSMMSWHDDFCRALAARGHYVIRYDRRDTGRSTTTALGQPPYGMDELATDVVAVLDHHDVPAANLVGLSQGGVIVQLVALRHPERVASLILISTTPVAVEEGVVLPGMTPALVTSVDGPQNDEPDWWDRAAAIRYLVEAERPLAGAVFDERVATEVAERTVDTTVSLPHQATNPFAIAEASPPPPGAMARIGAPTVVVHGSDDPLFPIGHAEAMVSGIPGARLVVLEGVGHANLPRSTWPTVIDAIVSVSR